MIKRPGAILALLTALNLLNYLDRYVLSAVLPRMQEDLHFSNLVGGALATVFLLGYFMTSPLFGQLADRPTIPGGRKGLLGVGVAVWSAATFATGLAGGSGALVASRAVVGVGEASYATIAPTIIDDMAPAEKKGRWLSFFYMAMPIGAALGFVIGGIVQKVWGWRATFFFVGGPGVLAALLCLLIDEPKRKIPEPLRLLQTAGALWKVRLYRRGVLGYCAQTFAMGGFGYWAPTFILRRYGLPLEKGAGTFGALLVVAGGAGTFLGGWWADRWIARRKPTQAPHDVDYRVNALPPAKDPDEEARIGLRVCAISSAVAAPLAVACFLAPSASAFFVLGFLCELAFFLSTSPVNSVLLRTAPHALRGSAMALSIFSVHLFGDLWSPPLLGLLQDHFDAPVAMMLIPVAIAISAVLWIPPKASPN